VPRQAHAERNGGGSNADWDAAFATNLPTYVVYKDGLVWRLDPDLASGHPKSYKTNLNQFPWQSSACSW